MERRELSYRQQVFTYLRVFLGGGSVTCNKDALRGIEIEAQKQCLPFLAQYTRSEDGFGWEPTYFVTKLEQRDPTHIDFELAEGLQWSKGFGPVTASDVKFSYERMKGTDWSGYFDALDHVEVTGDRTGTLVLNKPFAPFIMITLCHGPGAVLCEKAVTEAGGKFTTEFPAVCGPYTFEQTPGQRATFSPNPDWSGPKPAFDTVRANIITEVKAAELAFEAGELDCTEVGADTLARYAKSMPDGAGIAVAGELQYMWLGMNTDNPKLRDKKVRRAIQHAVDVDSILAGTAWADLDDARGAQGIGGSIFELELDATHPLAFGIGSELPVFRAGTTFFDPSDQPGVTVARYAPEEPLLSGYVSEERLAQIPGAAGVVADEVGAGSVIAVMADPDFRGFWYGSAALLLNAVFFGAAF